MVYTCTRIGFTEETVILIILYYIIPAHKKVVFADFGKLIICTGKHDVKAASEYVRFVVDTITAHPVFEYVTIQPTKYEREKKQFKGFKSRERVV